MPTFGRKPSGNDIGIGHVSAGWIRGTIAGRVSANGWLYRFGARVGTQGGTATYQQALYEASGSAITSRVGLSEQGSIASIMDWGGNGVNQTVKPTAPIMVRTGRDYALPIRCLSGALAHGMDHSGVLMHDRAVGSFPDPFGATDVRPEGRLSAWAEIQTNRAPKKPTGLAPLPGANVVTTTPTLGGDFRDDDETLPGFGVGTADKVKSYRFEIWNAAKTSRVRDSGKLAATAGQQSARRVTWTPSALTPGAYVARLTVWDQFDVPSPQAEWSFTVNSGGAVGPEIKAAHIVGQQGGYALVNRNASAGNELALVVAWNHSGGLGAVEANLRGKSGGGTVTRPEVTIPIAVAAGASIESTITAGAGNFATWSATGGQRYTIEVQFKDSAGAWTPWTATVPFVINAAPGVPTSLSPASGAFSELIALSAVISDLNDEAESLTGEFAVRPAGNAGTGVVVPVDRRSSSGGRHYAQLSAAELPSYQGYEWRARGVDPWGKAGEWSGWQSFTYAQPPTISITSPADGASLDTGTPTIAFTSNRSILRYKLRIWNDATYALVYEHTENVSGLGASHTVAVGVLRNQITYRSEVEVTDTSNLVARVARTFTISYTQPTAVATLTVDSTPGPFEASQPPAGWSQITVSWSEPTLAQAPLADFKGYVLRMTALSTGIETTAAVITSRDERVFIHRTPTSGEVYDYSVVYLVERNQVDTVESVRAVASGGVTLTDTVIVTLDEDALGAPLRFWERRDVDWITDVEIVPSWTDQPIGFQGSSNFDVIEGTFLVMDDELGSYTAREIVTAVRAMAGPWVDAEGRLRPRVIAYRDPKGRNAVVVLSKGGESDRHVLEVGEMSLTFTTVDVAIGALIGTAGA
jgi:hypothetical protein